jgi:hypothetical protein
MRSFLIVFILTKLLSYYLNPIEKCNILKLFNFHKILAMKNPQKALSPYSILPKKKTLLFNAPKNHVLRDVNNLKASKSPQNVIGEVPI